MQDHNDEARRQEDDVDSQVGGAGLQRPAIQHLVLTAYTNRNNFHVGESNAADGGAQQDHRVAEAVDVINEDAFTGQLEQGGVVAERVEYN